MELEKYIPQATVSKLADRPKDSAAELKAKFDEAEKNIGEYINEKLIPELEGMEEYSNIAFRYAGTIASGDEMPVLTTSDAGKVYNILDDRTYEYTCVWEGAVTKTDNYAYIHVSGIYDNIHNVYRMRYDQFVTSKTDKTKTNKVFYDGRDESGDARFKYDYNYEPKILFEDEEEVIVTIDTNIKLLRGENIVWTGHFWNKLSCDTDYKVEKDSCYPVQSGAVYNAIKEHSDNKENPHNVTASQIPADKDLILPPGTVGWELQELGLSIKVANEGLELHAAQINNPHKVTKGQIGLGNVDNTSDIDKPLSNAMKSALNGKLSVEMVYNPDDCYSVGISRLYYVINMQNEEKGNYYLLSFTENHPEFVTTYPPSENEYTLNVIQYKFAGGDVKKRAGKLFYKEYNGEHTYLDREWGKWDEYVTGTVLDEKIGDIDEALEEIIAIQNQLMGVSE